MSLAAILASVDGLAEAVRGEYRPATEAEAATNPALKGKFILDVTPAEGFGLDNVDLLRGNLGREKTAREKAEATAAKFGNLKPDDVQARLEKLTQLEAIDPEKQADQLASAKIDAVKRDMISSFDEERTTLRTQAERYRGQLDGTLRRGEAVSAISEAKGSVEALLPHVLGQTKFVEGSDGKFSVQVVDPDGNPRVGDAAGNPMSLTQLVDEFKKKEAFAPLFDASDKQGGGANQGGGGGNLPPTGRKKSDMTPNEKAAFIDTHGSAAFLALAS